MKKQLIALRGTKNVGKSSSIQLLYRILICDPTAKAVSFQSIGRKLDFIAVLEIGGVKIGLVNRGDVPALLKKLLKQLVSARCDIIVCAARTQGAVSTLLTSFDPPYEFISVSKSQSNNAPPVVSNLAAAHMLASLIYAAIDA